MMFCCLCVDADWAHPEVSAFLLDRLERSRVRFTFFATEDQQAPVHDRVEIAWHPNFERGRARLELDQLRERFPGARGVRPHRLSWGDCHSRLLKEFGVHWTSSEYRPDDQRILKCDGLVEVPISWGDNWWFIKQLEPDWEAMRSPEKGVYVLNVHPIHVFLNTTNLTQYERAKSCYHDPEALRALRDEQGCGVDDVLEKILEVARQRPESFRTLSECTGGLSTNL